MLRTILISLSLLFAASNAYAIEPVYSSWGKAIKGYDPVAYFTESKAVKGDKQHTVEWNGASWYFASADNAELFKAEPEKYAPQYGGYCAYAVSQGITAKIDPQAWTIDNGKLYLNYNKSVLDRWNEDRTNHIIDADKNWPEILKK